jgi:hypothetical protein
MKTVQITHYEAFDGRRFDTAKACKEHEDGSLHMRLVGLTEEQVINAINRDDADLADVIERIGIQIRADRRKSGDLKRPPRTPRLQAAPPDAELRKELIDAAAKHAAQMADLT